MNKLHFIAIPIIAIWLLCSCDPAKNKTKKEAKTNETTAENPSAKKEKMFDADYIVQCAHDGNIEPVKGALANGFDPNTFNSQKRTALMLAAFNGHDGIVSLLIEKGAKVNLTDAENQTALMFASTGPFASTVSILLTAGANPNMAGGQEKWSAVMWAAAEGQLEVVKVLVENGADLTMADIDGENSLYFAEQKGHTDVIAYIKSKMK